MRLRYLAAVAALVLPLSIKAESYTYTYTGSDFTYFTHNTNASTSTPVAPYTATDSVTGSFTINGSVDNLSGVVFFDSGPFSFTDGVQTISSADGNDLFARISTDASGNITSFAVEASSTSNLNDFISIQNLGGIPNDFGKFQVSPTDIDSAGNEVAGSFAAPVATPEPSSLALLGSGAIGLACQLRRRMRRA
jgi:hypothetical protein